MSYEEEKKYLIQKAIEFLGCAEVVWLEDVKGNTDYITLKYYGEPLEVELVGLEEGFLEDGSDITVRTYSVEYPDGADSSCLKDLSNDEIKKIFDAFDIDY